MVEITLAQAFQKMLDEGFAKALNKQGIDLEIARDLARVANEGSARSAMVDLGINPDQMVTMDESGQCVAECCKVLIPAPDNGPTPGRRSLGLAKTLGSDQKVTVDATSNSEHERAARYLDHLRNG